MKQFWIGTLVLLLFAAPRPADGQDVRLGLRVGTSLSSFRGDTESVTDRGHLNLSPHIGPALSGYAAIQGGRWIASRLELAYVQKGGSVSGTSEVVCFVPPCPTFQIDETYRISYLEVPMLATVRLPLPGRFSPQIHVGQFVGFTLDAELPERGEFDEVRRTSYGLLIGAGLDYSLKSGRALTLDVRYNRSLNTFSEDENVRVDGLTIGLGYTSLLP